MKKFFKFLKWLGLAVAAVVVLDLAVILTFANLHPRLEKADAIVVLGAAINSPALHNRSIQGLKLYDENLAPVLVLSGGRISDQDITEATYMKKVILQEIADQNNFHPLLTSPVPSSIADKSARYYGAGKGEEIKWEPPIILEQNSHTTFENLENSKALLPNAQSIIIVTDRYHIARAMITAKRAGFGAVSWSAPVPYYHKLGDQIYYYFREALAMLAYVPKFIVGR
jgi:uncharacterized SAM-binding protein YcdF (DUF218 family)